MAEEPMDYEEDLAEVLTENPDVMRITQDKINRLNRDPSRKYCGTNYSANVGKTNSDKKAGK